MKQIRSFPLFCVSALFSSTSPCPFLNRLPSNYLKNYGNSLVKIYGEHCPAVNRAAAASAIHQQVQQVQVSPVDFRPTTRILKNVLPEVA